MEFDREKLIGENIKEYGEVYNALKWVTDEESQKAEIRRETILNALSSEEIHREFNQTKLYSHKLSPGCLCCGQGQWSCLFINSLCNARCFYCPSEQKEKGEPTTNTLQFSNPNDYADYVEKFKIKGVSISGGEPFMTFDRTLLYLSKVKKKFGKNIYFWLYTNGILADPEKLRRLEEAGLDEIRFDITANRYNLEKVKSAVGIIKTVTVEIPAIPEDLDILKTVVSKLKDAGVNFLNLHQLRCSPHNAGSLIQRGYSFLHGPKVTVLESELTALEVMKYSLENDIGLPVNYCSFIYKNQYQAAGIRKRGAAFVCKPFEEITEPGLIRSLSLKGSADELNGLVAIFEKNICDKNLWSVNRSKNHISFHSSLLKYVDAERYPILVSYYTTSLKSAVSYRNVWQEIPLNRHKKIVAEKQPLLIDSALDAEEIKQLEAPRESGIRDRLYSFEHIRPGLYEYF